VSFSSIPPIPVTRIEAIPKRCGSFRPRDGQSTDARSFRGGDGVVGRMLRGWSGAQFDPKMIRRRVDLPLEGVVDRLVPEWRIAMGNIAPGK